MLFFLSRIPGFLLKMPLRITETTVATVNWRNSIAFPPEAAKAKSPATWQSRRAGAKLRYDHQRQCDRRQIALLPAARRQPPANPSLRPFLGAGEFILDLLIVGIRFR